MGPNFDEMLESTRKRQLGLTNTGRAIASLGFVKAESADETIFFKFAAMLDGRVMSRVTYWNRDINICFDDFLSLAEAKYGESHKKTYKKAKWYNKPLVNTSRTPKNAQELEFKMSSGVWLTLKRPRSETDTATEIRKIIEKQSKTKVLDSTF